MLSAAFSLHLICAALSLCCTDMSVCFVLRVLPKFSRGCHPPLNRVSQSLFVLSVRGANCITSGETWPYLENLQRKGYCE